MAQDRGAREGRNVREYDDTRDMRRFWKEIEPKGEPFRARWYVPLLLFFVVLSIPWYYDSGSTGAIVGGLPVWVWTSMACAFAAACVTAWASICLWKDDEDESE